MFYKIKNEYFKTFLVLNFLILFTFLVIISGENFIDNINNLENFLFSNFYFLFFIVINLSLLGLVILAISPYGKKKLGGEKVQVEHSNFSWYAMLFSAGMGVGIMFYGVAEPLAHFSYNPLFISNNKEISALATTYFSWGIHAWTIYILLGLAFAYFAYNKNLPLALRSLFYPIFKEKIFGRLGDIIDVFGAIVTLFALSSSLSLGAMQINSGLNYLANVPISAITQSLIIIVVIMIATLSVISGLDKGVKLLSNFNLRLAITLAIILLIIGPTLLIFKNLFSSSFLYFVQLVPMSLKANHTDLIWSQNWDIFYMSWWISWSIFVGMFIAKISKGRTIREFIFSILLIPTILIIIWFCILGTCAIQSDVNGTLTNIVNSDVSLALFGMINLLVQNNILISILQLLALIIIVLFFITSSDSGSLIVNDLTSTKKTSSIYTKILWSLVQGFLAIIIILSGGQNGINLIQNLLIIISLPLTIFLFYTLVILIYEIINDNKDIKFFQKIKKIKKFKSKS